MSLRFRETFCNFNVPRYVQVNVNISFITLLFWKLVYLFSRGSLSFKRSQEISRNVSSMHACTFCMRLLQSDIQNISLQCSGIHTYLCFVSIVGSWLKTLEWVCIILFTYVCMYGAYNICTFTRIIRYHHLIRTDKTNYGLRTRRLLCLPNIYVHTYSEVLKVVYTTGFFVSWIFNWDIWALILRRWDCTMCKYPILD